MHHFGGRDAFLGMDVDRDAAAVVATVTLPSPFRVTLTRSAWPGQRLVDGVVDHLVDHVVQARAVVGVADIHARPFAHGIEAAQDGDRGGVIGVGFASRIRLRRGVVTHADQVLRGRGMISAT
jgi:hypothetical protein